MSDPERNERPAPGISESCPIPNASVQQETQSDFSGSVITHGSEVCSPEQVRQTPSRSVSTSYVPSPEMRARKDADLKNHDCTPQNAKSCTNNASEWKPQIVNQSPSESDLRDTQKLSSDEKKVTIPTQVVDPDTGFVVVTGKSIWEHEYSNGVSSGYVNLLTEDESSLSTTESEDALSSGACSNTTMVEDKAEIHRDLTTDNIGEDDDGLPFYMDDINEPGTHSSIDTESREQANQCNPIGLTSSLPLSFGNVSNIRPPLTITSQPHNSTSGSESSATPIPSPSTSNASETSTASSNSSAVPSHTSDDIYPEVSQTCQFEEFFKRPALCLSIARLSPQTAFNFKHKFKVHGIKGEFQFHSRGLDQDYRNRNGTLTAVFKLPKKPQRINMLNYENCEFKIAVNVYEGPVNNERCIGQSSSTRSLDDDDRKRGTLHMTVHEVVSLQNIIFTDMDPPADKIFMQLVVELKAKGQKNVQQQQQAKQEVPQ